jgi:hypothetical protein
MREQTSGETDEFELVKLKLDIAERQLGLTERRFALIERGVLLACTAALVIVTVAFAVTTIVWITQGGQWPAPFGAGGLGGAMASFTVLGRRRAVRGADD